MKTNKILIIKNLFPLFIIIALTARCFGQVKMQGQVIAKDSMEPIPFAYLMLPSRSIGIAADENGRFNLDINGITLNDSMIVSSIGYLSYKGKLKSLTGELKNDHLNVTIALDVDPILLDDLEINQKGLSLDVDALMDTVLQLYHARRRRTPHIARAIVSEKAQVDGKYVMFNEAFGYSIYLGENSTWAALANYHFYPENMRKCTPEEQWVSFTKYLRSDNKDILYGGSNTINAFRRFEIKGILSNNPGKYQYKMVNTYSEGSRKVIVVEFKGILDKGIIEIYGNDYQIRQIKSYGKYIWSTAYHKSVFGDLSISFSYFNDRPFVDRISTHYTKGNLEHWNEIQVVLQKYDEFKVNNEDFGRHVYVSVNPFVYYDPQPWKYDGITSDGTLETIAEDLGPVPLEEQFVLNSGSQYLGGAMDRQAKDAREIIESLLQLF